MWPEGGFITGFVLGDLGAGTCTTEKLRMSSAMTAAELADDFAFFPVENKALVWMTLEESPPVNVAISAPSDVGIAQGHTKVIRIKVTNNGDAPIEAVPLTVTAPNNLSLVSSKIKPK